MLLSSSLYSQCAVVLSHKGIAEVSGLPEYMVSTAKVLDPRANNERFLTDTNGALHQDSILDASHPPSLNLNIIIIMVFSRPINKAEKSKGKLVSREQ
jgi:hypothetical protein